MESSHSGSIQPLAPLPRAGMRQQGFSLGRGWSFCGPGLILRCSCDPGNARARRSAVSGTQQGVGRDQVHTAFDITVESLQGHVRRVLQAMYGSLTNCTSQVALEPSQLA